MLCGGVAGGDFEYARKPRFFEVKKKKVAGGEKPGAMRGGGRGVVEENLGKKETPWGGGV